MSGPDQPKGPRQPGKIIKLPILPPNITPFPRQPDPNPPAPIPFPRPGNKPPQKPPEDNPPAA